MLALLALTLAVAPAQSGDIVMREPPRPSRVTTQLDVECGGKPILVRWLAQYPGYHEIQAITVDGVPLAEDQFRTLMSLVVDLEIENVSVLQCGDQDGIFRVDLILQFGEASARRANWPRIVSLRVVDGRVTVLRRGPR